MSLLQADVLILGAGPAGAAAALNLAGRHRVLMVERLTDPAPRIGESLPPAAMRLLADMGLQEEFLRQGHRHYHGNRALWNGAAGEYHFLRDPDGHGWHLDRSRFDGWLRSKARERGAALLSSSTVIDVQPDLAGAGGWLLRLRTPKGECVARAGIVIDAGGRAAMLARKLGACRLRQDKLVCGWLLGRDQAWGGGGFAHIESSEHGWWYSAALPGQRRVLAFHTDADLEAARCLRSGEWLLSAARRLPGMGALLDEGGFAATGAASVTAAHSSTLSPAAGPGWYAVGDAAASFDPLSSQGLFNALYTGLAAAVGVDRNLDGDARAHQQYLRELASITGTYREHLSYWYGQERRWTQAPFWQRRVTA